MSIKDKRNAERRISSLFNLARPAHNPEAHLMETRGYPTKASDFEGQGWSRWVNGSFRIGRCYVNEYENETTGTPDLGVSFVLTIIGDPELEGDSCKLTFRGLEKAAIWDDDNVEEDFFARSDREHFEKLLDVFKAVDDAYATIEDGTYADAVGMAMGSFKDLEGKMFTGSVKIRCYKPKDDPNTVKGPYAGLDRARKLDEDVANSLPSTEEAPF